MACPTCDKTMHAMGCKVSGDSFYWCPICGTVLACDGAPPAVPALVDRCRLFRQTTVHDLEFAGNRKLDRLWHTLGISESINTPENRR